MKKHQQIIFTILLFIAIAVDGIRGYSDLLIYSGLIKTDYTTLYCLLDSLMALAYVSVLTYISFIYCTMNIAALITYNFLQGCWLMMALIDLKQEWYKENITYDATEISMMMFSIALTIIISAYQWSKRKNLTE